MKTISKRLMAIAIAGTVFSAGFAVTAVFAAYSGNDTAAHKSSATITNAECVACHGQKAYEPSLDVNTYSAHKRHLYSAFLRFTSMNDGCAQCHVATDIEQGSGATVNKQVDAQVCASCHGKFPVVKHGGTDYAATSPRGCTATTSCHKGGGSKDPAIAHAAAGYVNTYFAASRTYCTKCHGGLDFYNIAETN